MKIAEFVLLDQYADWEGAYLSSQLNQKKDWQVRTASIKSSVKSIGGFTTQVDDLISDVPEHIDLLVLIGGNSWSITDEALYQLISGSLTNEIPVGAICGAVDFLARTGLLTGFKHTGNAQYLWKDYVDYKNPTDFQNVQVVSDRNLVTANGTAALDFTERVLKMIGSSAKEIAMGVELHKLGFYAYTEKYGNPYQ
ncbi:glutamine amidotransferase [Furfurilactobacillus rossiae]|nr:DJ-1/PfpI family protein [Furfurilactobacillus rossiae]MCF6165110.1 DJ-1/PfpI family protein [Furfurilactobacillus rossiae]QLE62876.1 glutamine amidotransferase [Furfurilactobacillus rossiae]